jgi:hypothetical protein
VIKQPRIDANEREQKSGKFSNDGALCFAEKGGEAGLSREAWALSFAQTYAHRLWAVSKFKVEVPPIASAETGVKVVIRARPNKFTEATTQFLAWH